MSDQWTGSEEDANRLTDIPGGAGSTSNAGMRAGSMGDDQGMSGMQGEGRTGSQTSGTMDKARDALSGMSERASGIGSQATSKADAGMEKAAHGLDTLADKVRHRSETMDGQVASIATAAADRMHSSAERIRGTDTDQLMNDLEALIRRRPLESLLVAAGIGYLISRAR